MTARRAGGRPRSAPRIQEILKQSQTKNGGDARLKAGLHVRRKHKHKHKPRVNRDDASTSAGISHVWTGTTQAQAQAQEKGTRSTLGSGQEERTHTDNSATGQGSTGLH